MEDLAHFLRALHAIDTTDAPEPGAHNFYRGVHLQTRDDATRRAIHELGDTIVTRALTHLWEASLNVDTWQKPPVWIHGDLQASNLLIEQGGAFEGAD